MAKRPSSPGEFPDALREAVEQTVQAARDSAQGLLGALDERRPATQEDVKELRSELRKIAKRLDAIEDRLPN